MSFAAFRKDEFEPRRLPWWERASMYLLLAPWFFLKHQPIRSSGLIAYADYVELSRINYEQRRRRGGDS